MLSQAIQDAINRQIDLELAGSHYYLALSTWCDEEGFRGASTWLRTQSLEERGHAMKLVDYLGDREGAVRLGAVPQPETGYDSLLELFEAVLEQERAVTIAIHELFREAGGAEPSLEVLLHWFISEQVEEEKTVSDIVADLRRIGDDPTGLLIVDRELASLAAAPDPNPAP
ncbi:MAG: ferritin [Acidobacteriota bacterium]|nr:ferritin [Acidobacteriota bacterium]